MSTSVIQCLDCGAWNWADREKCETCGSTNLTPSFHKILAVMCKNNPEFKAKIDAIYGGENVSN